MVTRNVGSNTAKKNTIKKSEGENMEHNEVVDKLFDIVEKVTERLAKLEKSNQILTNSANEG